MTKENGSNDRRPGSEEEFLARLLRLAGPRVQAPPDRAARVRAAAHASWREMLVSRRRQRRLSHLAIAASLGALVLAAGLLLRGRGGSSPRAIESPIATVVTVNTLVPSGVTPFLRPGTALAAGASIETGPSSRVALSLSAGQSVRLDVGTRLSLVSGSVLLLEQGAVYVDSGGGHSPGRSLEVRTAAGVARELGTQFEVRLEPDGARVRVREGAVSWALDGVRRETAGAGTEMRIDPRGVVLRASLSPDAPEWRWVQEVAPPFELEGRSLREFLEWVSRETGLPFRVADEAQRKLGDTMLHGSVQGMTPDEALPAVLATCGLSQAVENGVIVVRSAQEKRSR